VRIDERKPRFEPLPQGCVVLQPGNDIEQRVDNRVAGDVDRIGRGAFFDQIGLRPGGRGKVKVRHAAGEPAVHFFRPGRVFVVGAQARFDMPDPDFGVVGGKAGAQRGGGVAVNQHDVGCPGAEYVAHAEQHVARDVAQVLPRLHQVQIEIGLDAEDVEHLVEHLPVLGGDADFCINARIRREDLHDRRHLDGFGACTKNGEDFHTGLSPLPGCTSSRQAFFSSLANSVRVNVNFFIFMKSIHRSTISCSSARTKIIH